MSEKIKGKMLQRNFESRNFKRAFNEERLNENLTNWKNLKGQQ